MVMVWRKISRKQRLFFFECFNLQKQKGIFDYPEAAYYLCRELLSEVVAKDKKHAFKAFEFAKIHGSNLGLLWVGIC